MVISPLSISARPLDPQPCVWADTRKVEEGLLTAFLLTVFLTVGVFSALKRVKNLVNTGENVLEPVVGIEPTTYGLRNRCSTTELHRLKVNVYRVFVRFD